MKRIVQLNIKITALLDDKLDKMCSLLNLKKSTLVYKAIIFYLKSKGFRNIENSLKIEAQRNKIREDNYNLYTIKNGFVNVINHAKVSLLLTGDVNLAKVKYNIKNYIKLYNLMPRNLKKLCEDDMKTLKKLEFKPNLMQYMYDWDLVKEFIGLKERSKMKRVELKK